MNNLFQIYSCIKTEQKAITQFLELKKTNIFFNNFKRYLSFTIICFCIALSFLLKKKILFFYICCLLISLIFLLILLIFQNISHFFSFSKIYYEESSWFDLKIWQKPIFLIKNDKFFYHFQKETQRKFLYINLIIFSLFFLLFASLK